MIQESSVMIQESKLRNLGSLKLQGYQIFELNRQGMGGGLFTAKSGKWLWSTGGRLQARMTFSTFGMLWKWKSLMLRMQGVALLLN